MPAKIQSLRETSPLLPISRLVSMRPRKQPLRRAAARGQHRRPAERQHCDAELGLGSTGRGLQAICCCSMQLLMQFESPMSVLLQHRRRRRRRCQAAGPAGPPQGGRTAHAAHSKPRAHIAQPVCGRATQLPGFTAELRHHAGDMPPPQALPWSQKAGSSVYNS